MRSGSEKNGVICLRRRVLQAGAQILCLEVGVILKDLIAARARCEEREYVSDPHPGAANDRPTVSNGRIYRNAIVQCHV
jgi:glutamate mutase epsilon subunit